MLLSMDFSISLLHLAKCVNQDIAYLEAKLQAWNEKALAEKEAMLERDSWERDSVENVKLKKNPPGKMIEID